MTTSQAHTTQAARDAAERDELAAWVASFLASPGSDNAGLADELADPPRWWLGPVEIPLDQLNRLAGPAGSPVLQVVDDDEWRDDVDDLADTVEEGDDPPPVIATYSDDKLYLEDGNHRVEALRRAGVDTAWTVIGFDDIGARDDYITRSDPAPA